LDVETLFGLIFKEEDADTKQIYYFLFKLLRKSILNNSNEQTSPVGGASAGVASGLNSPLSVEAHLGKPPFEEPSITKAVVNFLFYKYGKSGELELQCMFEASKLFLYCFNMWKFETPDSFSRHAGSGGAEAKLLAAYKLNYTRWMCYNYVPSFCDSLEKHETIMIFGVSFLRLVFGHVRRELQEKFISEKEKIPAEKRSIFSVYLPRLLKSLDEELDDETSIIWSLSSHLGNSFPIYEAEIYSKKKPLFQPKR
jgi:histone acetyltransferase